MTYWRPCTCDTIPCTCGALNNSQVSDYPNAVHALIEKNVEIGEGTKIWHFSHISSGAKIGENCTIGDHVFVGKNVVIGNGCKIQNNVFIPNGVTIEDDVFIGPSVTFTNVINPRAFIERKDEFKQTVVCKGASIGANSTILCGISIGKYVMIGAGSVVINSINDFDIVVGNPAHFIGKISKSGNKIWHS